MKKILFEGLLVGLFLLIGVNYAQNVRTALKTPIIHSQKELQSFLEKSITRKSNHPSFQQSLLKSSNANSAFVADTAIVKSTWGDSRYSFIYDSKGKVASAITENLKNGRFEFRYRDSYTYDGTSKTKTKLVEKWFNGNWINDSRTTCVYDLAGNEV
ncbi:MAG: hypothetical protein Q8S39_13090, partial [Ignavibacteria bacterium]|nr:hypothetical protein [Ignavibacteria bacterium]